MRAGRKKNFLNLHQIELTTIFGNYLRETEKSIKSFSVIVKLGAGSCRNINIGVCSVGGSTPLTAIIKSYVVGQ